MSQYSSLFNSTRIPELKKDRLYQDKSKKHILVLRKGNFYTVEVLDENGLYKSIEKTKITVHDCTLKFPQNFVRR